MTLKPETDRLILSQLKKLERLVERRGKEWGKSLERLERKGKELETEVKKHRKEIAGLKSPSKARVRKVKPRRPKRKPTRVKAKQRSLKDAISSLLIKKGPMKPREITALLAKAGYRTRSKNLSGIVRTRLSSAPEFRRAGAGQWTVRKRK